MTGMVRTPRSGRGKEPGPRVGGVMTPGAENCTDDDGAVAGGGAAAAEGWLVSSRGPLGRRPKFW